MLNELTFEVYQREAVVTVSITDKAVKGILKAIPEGKPKKEVAKLLRLSYLMSGLGSEVGEVQGKFKKIIRDKGAVFSKEDVEALVYEMGDSLWYLAAMCDTLGVTLNEVAHLNIKKLRERQKNGKIHGNGDKR